MRTRTPFYVALLATITFAAYVLAQTPATVHATWTPNPTTDNVVDYIVSVDGVAAATVLASACSATVCPAAPGQLLTIPTFGLHSVSVVAQNLKLSTDPTSLQSGPADTIAFTLGSIPVVVSGGAIKN